MELTKKQVDITKGTAILFMLLLHISQYINKIVEKCNVSIILILSFVIYFIGYIQRIMVPVHTNNEIINYKKTI